MRQSKEGTEASRSHRGVSRTGVSPRPPDPTRRRRPTTPPHPTRRNNERSYGTEGIKSSFAPFIPSQKSRTCNAVSNMQRLVSPQTTHTLDNPNKSFYAPLSTKPHYRPLSVALAPSQARSYLAYYLASISPLYHWACALLAQIFTKETATSQKSLQPPYPGYRFKKTRTHS